MDALEIVKHIMILNHVSYDELSHRLGYKSKANSFQRLNGKHVYVDTWKKFLDELGYEIVVRKKGEKGSGYVVGSDNLPSPLRFHGMDLDFARILSPAKEKTNE